ncbi:MAG: hypothetical protein R3B06_24315 [Kofleriaceae bacterium]
MSSLLPRVAPLALLLAALPTTACTPSAITPPARTFAFDSATAPAVGQTDVQVDLARAGTPFGPELIAGGGRVRHAVRPGILVEGEAGTFAITNEGSGPGRMAYTGRAGAMFRPEGAEGLAVAFNLGAGGGYAPAAGGWASADLGAVVTGTNRWVRPVLGVDVSHSRPIGNKVFTVTEPDGTASKLRLPVTTSLRGTAGLEIGPPDRAVILGASWLHGYRDQRSRVDSTADEPSAEDYLLLGAGVRVGLD